ncbi:MAG: tRNA pseudouridine(13) synthase TruD [Promethearchaeota archaeon]|nr:MAG: tRNA pseudouridine(13) synthase TruD [Candidatus Lokiarchaeota archaeon]
MKKNQELISISDLEKHVGISTFSTTTPSIHGDLKVYPEDFIVCEITPVGRILSINEPNYVATQGPRSSKISYTLVDVVKKNEDTILAAEKIARKLNIDSNYVSWAGLKDNRAITAQRMTIKGDHRQKLMDLHLDTLFIKNIHYSKTPIKLGDLWGNKFEIILRNIEDFEKNELTSITTNFQRQIARNGFPNYYGLQRFGSIRPNSHLVGKYIFLMDYQKAVEEFLYATYFLEHENVKICRKELHDTQDFEKALSNFPEGLYYERLMIKHIANKPDDYFGALRRIPRPLLNLLMSSYQSYLFNIAVSERMRKIGNLTEPKPNDMISLLLEENGLTTPVRYTYKKWKKPHLKKVLEMDRARIMCPILGYDSKLKDSYFKKTYSRILRREEFKVEYFKNGKELKAYDFRGSFRGIIVKPKDLQVVPQYDNRMKPNIEMRFSLPKGTYATMLMRELTKY